MDCFVATLLAMTADRDALRVAGTTEFYLTTPEMNPALRRGGFISFFRKQYASRPTYPGRA
jgi:hypothetical protein